MRSSPVTAILAVLWYAYWITKDWRKRAEIFAATAYLDEGSLRKAHAHAIALVAQYVEAPVGKKPSLEKAENALVIATVLQEYPF